MKVKVISVSHTPGPWIWDEPSNWYGLMARVCTEKHEPIAHVQVSGWKKKQAIATAKLIAASPDLLAACKVGLQELESFCHAHHVDASKNLAVAVLRGAIAKAGDK